MNAPHSEMTMLRVLTCGSVDDGKSTLVGRLLYDTGNVHDDQIVTLTSDSKRYGTNGEDLDLALLVDGLSEEREQGITIDVAYRFMSTDARKFIIADTPGHEEYTRNMATGASNAQLAILLVDASKGLTEQTLRHACISSLLGIKKVVLTVNKIDTVDFDQAVFDQITQEYEVYSKQLNFVEAVAIPVSARLGDNVVTRSERMPWYPGPTLLEFLEGVSVDVEQSQKPFRFPVQIVCRPDMHFRGFAGQVASGTIKAGDRVRIAKSGVLSTVKEIVTMDGPLQEAREGQAVTIVLSDQVDVSRGNILAPPDDGPMVADQFQAHVIWFDDQPLLPGRQYILRTECDAVTATVSTLKYKIEIPSLNHAAATTLSKNEFGVCNFSLLAKIAFDSYEQNRKTGAFILIDQFSNRTVGAGMIDFQLRRAENIHWQKLDISRSSRAQLMGHKPAVVWLTGLSGSGKSTIANQLERLLHSQGKHTILLDGDNVRSGLNRDLGFTEADRVENIRRVAEVAKLMTDAGLIVIVAFISPFKSERELARDLMEPGEFVEVFIDTPLDECIRRDPKGLYKKALAGEIFNFTGMDSVYEPPEHPQIHAKTVEQRADSIAVEISQYLDDKVLNVTMSNRGQQID
jgi:bifunctional enzyme CysN/CysC